MTPPKATLLEEGTDYDSRDYERTNACKKGMPDNFLFSRTERKSTAVRSAVGVSGAGRVSGRASMCDTTSMMDATQTTTGEQTATTNTTALSCFSVYGCAHPGQHTPTHYQPEQSRCNGGNQGALYQSSEVCGVCRGKSKLSRYVRVYARLPAHEKDSEHPYTPYTPKSGCDIQEGESRYPRFDCSEVCTPGSTHPRTKVADRRWAQ